MLRCLSDTRDRKLVTTIGIAPYGTDSTAVRDQTAPQSMEVRSKDLSCHSAACRDVCVFRFVFRNYRINTIWEINDMVNQLHATLPLEDFDPIVVSNV